MAGRPSKYDSIDLEQVRKLAEKGWTDAEMANFFDVNPDTWHEWKKAHPEFSESLKDWKQFADDRVERSLYERAIGYQHPHEEIMMAQKTGQPVVVKTIKHFAPDPTSMIFWLKNRKPKEWRDKQEIEMDSKGVVNLIFKQAEGCEPLNGEQ
jgi:hypothetical protein